MFLDKKEIFFYVNGEKLIREKCLRYYKTIIRPGYAMWIFDKHISLLASVSCGKSYRKTTAKQPAGNHAIVSRERYLNLKEALDIN